MQKTALFIFTLFCLMVLATGCNNGEKDGSILPAQNQSSIPTSEQKESGIVKHFVFNKTLEKYYDYFRKSNQIVALLDFNENGFTDDELAAFTLLNLDNYNYEKGNSKEEFDAVTEKYFGRKIKNFNNTMSEIIPGTNMIRATGWSFDSSIFMILKSLIEERDGSKTTEFYMLNISDSILMDIYPNKTEEQIKNDLLSGLFSDYGEPFLVKLKFEEKTDENGKLYLKYLDIEKVYGIVEKMTPYGAT